jgi:MFS family permease
MVVLSRWWKPSERGVALFGIFAGLFGFLLITFGVTTWLFILGIGIASVSMLSLGAITSYAARLGPPSLQGGIQGVLSGALSLSVLATLPFGLLFSYGQAHAADGWLYPSIPYAAATLFCLCAAVYCVSLPPLKAGLDAEDRDVRDPPSQASLSLIQD